MAQNAAAAMDTAGNVGGITPDGVYFIRDGKLTYYRYDELGGGGGGTGHGIPAGGTTGQVLAKSSDASYEAEWVDPQGGVSFSFGEIVTKLPIISVSNDKKFATYRVDDSDIGDYDLLNISVTYDNRAYCTLIVFKGEPSQTYSGFTVQLGEYHFEIKAFYANNGVLFTVRLIDDIASGTIIKVNPGLHITPIKFGG